MLGMMGLRSAAINPIIRREKKPTVSRDRIFLNKLNAGKIGMATGAWRMWAGKCG